MNATITIETAANGTESRTLAPGRYALGRSPECDLQFAGAGAESVSWTHAEISVRPEGAFLKDLNSSNGTWLNGRKVPVETKILDGDEIRLGQSGPRVRVVQIPGAVPVSAGNGHGQGPLAFGSDSMQGAAPFAGAPPAPGLYGPGPQSRPQAAVASKPAVSSPIAPPAAPVPAAEPRRSSTTRAMLIDLKKSQRGWRGLGIAAMIGLCIALVVSLVLFAGKLTSESQKRQDLEKDSKSLAKQTDALKGETKKLSGETKKLADRPATDFDTKAIVAANRDCVFLVGQIQGDKVTPFGTAFAVDANGTFGTNAHVTHEVKKRLAAGMTYYVIGEGGKVKYRILSAKSHPDWKEKLPKDNYSPDVGILKVDLPAGTKLKHVTLGDAKDFAELTDGSKLCYIGFPVYLNKDYGILVQVKARINSGSVVRMLTLTGSVGEQKDQLVFEHNMNSWGGASGSPIFNERGHVVGLHFAANPIVTEMTTVTPTGSSTGKSKFVVSKGVAVLRAIPGGTKYAIRADKLLELLK